MWDLAPFRSVVTIALEKLLLPSSGPEWRMKIDDCADPAGTSETSLTIDQYARRDVIEYLNPQIILAVTFTATMKK
jgi:hypothetical protein